MVIMNNVNTTERLIHEVRERPPLWDQRNLNYHNRVVVNALWQEIANLLQVNKEAVKVKWKGLRDTFRRELKKQRNNAIAHYPNEPSRDPSWTHYSSMNFLRDYMGNSNNHSDLFQFHGWSTEDIVVNDAVGVVSAEDELNATNLLELSASGGSDVVVEDSPQSPPATFAAVLVKEEPVNEQVNGAETALRQSESNRSSPSPAMVTSKLASTTVPAKAKSKRKRSSINRISRLKENHRLRSKLSKKGARIQQIRTPSPPSILVPAASIAATVATVATSVGTQSTAVYEEASHRGGSSSFNAGVTVHHQEEVDSEDDLYFFKSLIPYVKNLPPARKLYLRAEIHNLVLREVVGENTISSVIPLEHVSVGMHV